MYDLALSPGSLDADKLADYVMTHDTGVDVLLAPARPDQASAITIDLLRDVLVAARATYDFVIADTPPGFTAEVIATIDSSSDLVMVGTLDSLSLKNTKLGLETLGLMEYDTRKIQLVLNRADTRVGIRAMVERGWAPRRTSSFADRGPGWWRAISSCLSQPCRRSRAISLHSCGRSRPPAPRPNALERMLRAEVGRAARHPGALRAGGEQRPWHPRSRLAATKRRRSPPARSCSRLSARACSCSADRPGARGGADLPRHERGGRSKGSSTRSPTRTGWDLRGAKARLAEELVRRHDSATARSSASWPTTPSPRSWSTARARFVERHGQLQRADRPLPRRRAPAAHHRPIVAAASAGASTSHPDGRCPPARRLARQRDHPAARARRARCLTIRKFARTPPRARATWSTSAR